MTTQASIHTLPLSETQPQVLPEKFVYLEDVVPSILQEVRYAGFHNFVGRPIPSYLSSVIITTEPVAFALKAVQEELNSFQLTLKVYDAYRPQDASDYFARWAQDPDDQLTQKEFYPAIHKRDLFKAGYIAKRSSHSRGSAVDLTIVPLPEPYQPRWNPGDPVLDGRLPRGQ